MKRMFAFIMAMCLCIAGAAFAEDTEIFGGFALLPGDTAEVDLNGDGAAETIGWQLIEDEENYTEQVVLTITAADGSAVEWSEYLYMASVIVSDVDSDGVYEIFITGDEMSADYLTYCLHYTGSELLPLMFADTARGAWNGGYYKCGYGYLEAIVDGAVTLSGSQDILGTYFGSRVFGLQHGIFEIVDDGMWRFDNYDFDDPDVWEYVALKPVADINAMFITEDGDEQEGVIAAGERFIVTASDKESVVYFRMQDGRCGYFWVMPDYEWGFGYYIDGVYEDQIFEYIPYAD